MGSSHQGFYPNVPFFQDGAYKTRRIIKYFSKKQKNEFICVKLNKFHLLRKSLTKLKLIFRGNSRYTAILISLTTKSQR